MQRDYFGERWGAMSSSVYADRSLPVRMATLTSHPSSLTSGEGRGNWPHPVLEMFVRGQVARPSPELSGDISK